MKSILFAVTAGLLACAEATQANSTIWTTVVTTDFTTYCPSATTFAYHNVTYTATSATTITVSDCPCTISYHQPPPVTTTAYDTAPPTTYNGTVGVPTVYPNGSSTVITYTPGPSSYLSGTTVITPPSNSTISEGGAPSKTPVAPTTVPGGSPSGTTNSAPPAVTAGAGKAAGPIGALLAVGLAAFAL